MKQQLYELLTQCTVRVSISGESGHGTGFFVAPGLVLTCAHVIKSAQPDFSQVQIDWEEQAYQAQIMQLHTEHDLALLQVNLSNHPCVYLHEEATPLDDLYSYGYTDDHRDGDPATFTLEGTTGEQEEHLKFKSGQVRPGLSGAPLLNIRTGYVCGIVRMTRARNDDLGGRAIPARAIFQVFPDIIDLQRSFHEQDQQWVDLREIISPLESIGGKLTQIETISELVHTETGLIKEGQDEILSLLSGRTMQRSEFLFFPPLPDVPDFTGRSDELEQLRQLLLTPGESQAVRIVGLVGTGGMGKSTLACHFATTYKEHFPDGVFGVQIGHKSVDVLAQELAFLAGVEIDPRQNYNASVIMQKVFGNRRALLIFDNTEDGRVQELHPGGETCAVIVTTRNRNLFQSLKISPDSFIDLEGFTLEETHRFFVRLLGEQRVDAELEAVQKIHDLVGALPLALRIIGGTLQDQKFTTLAKYAARLEYATRLEKEKQRLSSFLQNPDDAKLNVYSSFSLSLESLKKEEEKLLFACLGACAPEGFSLRAAQAASHLDEDAAYDGMVRLSQLSLVNRGTAGDRYLLHPLLFNFARELAEEQNLLTVAEQRHTEFFVAYAEEHKVLSPADFEMLEGELDALILTGERLKDDVPRAVAFYMILKPLLQSRGHWSKALAWVNMLLEAARKKENTFYEAFCLLQCETFLHRFAQFEKAEQYLIESEQLAGKVEDVPQRIALIAMLRAKQGGIYRELYKLVEAEKVLKESLVLWEALGRTWERGKVLNKLGALYLTRDRTKEAENALRESLAIYEQLHDLRRKSVVLSTLGGLYQKRKQWQEAELVLKEALAIAEQLGDRKGIGIVQGRLVRVYRAQRKEKEAKAALLETLSIATEIGDLKYIASALDMLKDIYVLEGKSQDALDIIHTHLEFMRKAAYQEGIARLLKIAGELYLSQNRIAEAEEALREGLKIARSSVDLKLIADVFIALAKVYHEQENHRRELEVLQETIQVCTELDNKPGMGIILQSLGLFYQKQKWYEPASVCFEKCFEIQEEERSHLIGKTTHILVHDLLALHKKDLAQQYCERALAIVPDDTDLLKAYQRILNVANNAETLRDRLDTNKIQENTQDKAMSLHKLGRLYQEENQIAQAEKAFLESLEIGRKLKLTRHIGIVLRSLGEVYASQGKIREAEATLEESYTLAAEKRNKLGMAKVQETRGKLLLDHGEVGRASTCLQESFVLYEELQNSQGINTLYFLVRALMILNKEREAQAYLQRAGTLWSGDPRMLTRLRYLQRKISIQIQQSTRKMGVVKRLIPAGPSGSAYGFIAPDDGSQDIYFKQEIVPGELMGRFQKGLRIWADIQMVKGRPQAVRVGAEADLQAVEAEITTLKVEEEAASVSNNLTLLKVLKAEDEKTLRNLLETDDTQEKAYALHKLGKLYQSESRIDQAEEAFLESLEIGRKLELTTHTGIALRSLGEIYVLQGKVGKAEETLEESYLLAAKEGDKPAMAEIQRWRGKLLLDHGEMERASTYLQQSFALCEELQNKGGIKVLYFVVRALMILNKEEEARTYWLRAETLWPEDSEMLKVLERVELEFSISLRQSTRKTGRIKRLIPGPHGSSYGFIVPDDGGQDIYFKQEVVESELVGRLQTGMRIWADVQVVGGRSKAVKIGNNAHQQKPIATEANADGLPQPLLTAPSPSSPLPHILPCGHPLRLAARFCPTCGQPVEPVENYQAHE
ncbi:MAG: tetratricopeptide repeat protein [Ktedonobacteraceae bacterium]